MTMRRFVVLLGCLLAATLGQAQEEHAPHKVLSKTHDRGHAAIEEELKADQEQGVQKPQIPLPEDDNVESFTCTITGAGGQDQCDAATDDDGSKCVWCVLNNFGFCVSGEQAAQFEQVMPTIDCDDQGDDDKTPAGDDDKAGPDTDDAVWSCLESKDEASCGDKCVWCNTKGGFGVCLSPDAADEASQSYWFDCPSDYGEYGDDDDEEEEDRYYPEEGDYEDEEEMEDYVEGGDDEEEYSDDEDYDEEEGLGVDEEMHEFVVDTGCVLSGMLLDPADEDATSEAACYRARDVHGHPCEWCAVAGSPFRLCLSEPQAQVAEYVGAVCTGSDESFEPEDFDDSCIAHMVNDRNLSKEGCWQNKDLDGNGCEWCNIMGVEMCLGGVQAELVEHWGATCVMDHAEHAMAEEAIKQHLEFLEARKDSARIAKQAEKIAKRGEEKPDTPYEDDEEEEELDIQTLWLTSDHSCMVTTLRTSSGHDDELACAQTRDAQGNSCNWCQLGTSFYMCLNEEQADVAEYMGIECETISTDTQEILDEHNQNADNYEDSDDEEQEEKLDLMNDVEDFDGSCILAMQNGPDQTTCVNTKDQDGQNCEWCSWNEINLCLASEQAEMVEPFGVKCDQVAPRTPTLEAPLPDSAALKELSAQVDTSCLIDAGIANDPAKCTSAKDALTGKPCEWCSLGSLGVHACMSAEQAEQSRPLGVTCQGGEPGEGVLQDAPSDFFSCLSQSQSVDHCDQTCTWCDIKGSPTGAGLCLSDPLADAISNVWPEGALDCTEPDDDEDMGDEEGEEDEEEYSDDDQEEGDDEYDDDQEEGDDEYDDDRAEEGEELDEEIA